MKLKRISKGVYQTEDGHFNIEFVDDYETTCDEPHPCRYRVDKLDVFSDWTKARILGSYGATTKLKRTKEGWVEYVNFQCPGGESHWYSRWIIIDNGSGDYPHWTGPDGFDTKAQAASSLEYHLTKAERTGTL